MSALTLVLVFTGGLVFDMGVNAAQNWYDVMYADAFWSHRVADSPALRQVSREELEIDRLMRGQDFVARHSDRESMPAAISLGGTAPDDQTAPQPKWVMHTGAPSAIQ